MSEREKTVAIIQIYTKSFFSLPFLSYYNHLLKSFPPLRSFYFKYTRDIRWVDCSLVGSNLLMMSVTYIQKHPRGQLIRSQTNTNNLSLRMRSALCSCHMAELQHFLMASYSCKLEKGSSIKDHLELTLAATTSTVGAHRGACGARVSGSSHHKSWLS